MILELLRNGAIEAPWPFIASEYSKPLPGRMGFNQICEVKCHDKPCKSHTASLIGVRCHLGLTVYEAKIDDKWIRVFGVVGPQHKEQLPTYSDYKSACKGRSVTAQNFSDWINSLRALSSTIKKQYEKELAQSLEPLHDAMRLATDVAQLAEQVLEENAPNAADKFAAGTQAQRSLMKAATLLEDTFELLEIYLNPNAATYGQPRSVEIYKLIDKLAKIAGLARRSERRPSVQLYGSTRRSYDVFESFKLIPLILIDNAQKYSRSGGSVRVEISELLQDLEVRVISEGPCLSVDEQRRVFERGYRGHAAQEAYPAGMGLGLYIAQTVARAHGFTIKVNSQPLGYDLGNFPQGKNTFSFTIKPTPVY